MAALVQTLIDQEQRASHRSLTRDLQELYGGDLQLDDETGSNPYINANFVATLDGVVSYKLPGDAGGSTISGADQADRFIMGLLRASVDAVMVGAGTVHDVSPQGLWTPEYACPSYGALYAAHRRDILHQSAPPLAVIVSGSGRLDLRRAVFRTTNIRTVVITTPAGREELSNAGVAELNSVEIHVLDAPDGQIEAPAILELLRRLRIRRLLHEGGPRLFASFLAHGALNELFLTLSPQIAGRGAHTSRPGLVEGMEFMPAGAPWFELLSAKRRADHLYMRYRYRARGG